VHSALRAGLFPQPATLPPAPGYRPMPGCTYQTTYAAAPGAALRSVQTNLVIRPVKNRLLATASVGTIRSTTLMTPDGVVQDFNWTSFIDGKRWTRENYSGMARAELAKRQPGERAYYLRETDLIFPIFRPGGLTPGQVAATVGTYDDAQYASFIYRGVLPYHQREAVLMDLVRVLPTTTGPAPVIIGFSLVDFETRLPLLLVLQPGSLFRMEELTCRPE
jgi:hypothetical protein